MLERTHPALLVLAVVVVTGFAVGASSPVAALAGLVWLAPLWMATTVRRPA